MIRASVKAMENASRQIFIQESLTGVEDKIASLDSIFRLQGADELLRAQERYLRKSENCRAIILAASRGNNLYELTADKPKAMLQIGGKPLLQRLVDEFKRQSINDITVIAGYKSETLAVNGIKLCVNEAYDSTGEVHSLACARDAFSDDMVIMYGDLLFRTYILRDLLDSAGEMAIVVDSLVDEAVISGAPDYAYCDRPDDRSLFMQEVKLQRISEERATGAARPSGRWTGMMRVKGDGRKWLEEALETLAQRDDFARLNLPDLLNHIARQGKPIKAHYINGHWLDVNSVNDIDRGQRLHRRLTRRVEHDPCGRLYRSGKRPRLQPLHWRALLLFDPVH